MVDSSKEYEETRPREAAGGGGLIKSVVLVCHHFFFYLAQLRGTTTVLGVARLLVLVGWQREN